MDRAVVTYTTASQAKWCPVSRPAPGVPHQTAPYPPIAAHYSQLGRCYIPREPFGCGCHQRFRADLWWRLRGIVGLTAHGAESAPPRHGVEPDARRSVTPSQPIAATAELRAFGAIVLSAMSSVLPVAVNLDRSGKSLVRRYL
jgi:hypothetical protein